MEILSEILKILGLKAVILSVIYILVFVLILLDLWSGIRKSKQNNQYISSYGLRKTIEKISRCFNMLFAITVVDFIQMIAVIEIAKSGISIPIFPILTFCGAIFIGITEVRSIFEKSEQKDKAKAAETAKLIQSALKNKDVKETIETILEQVKKAEECK